MICDTCSKDGRDEGRVIIQAIAVASQLKIFKKNEVHIGLLCIPLVINPE